MNKYVRQKLRGIRKTEATRFLLPMLGSRQHKDWFFVNEFFINAYIGDSAKPEYDNHIILRYRYVPNPRFIRFERELIVKKGCSNNGSFLCKYFGELQGY